MAVIAITPVQHGDKDGSVKTFNVGDDVSGLGEDAVRALVENGAAVETGKTKKYNSPLTGAGTPAVTDEDTLKRDQIIAKVLAGDDPSPGAAAASGSVDANAEGETTIGQTAADEQNEKKK